MSENIELYKHILKDCDMAKYTITLLLADLKQKDNKIKRAVEDILLKYNQFYDETKEYLLKHNATLAENGLLSKMGAGMGIKKEVKNDNSDSSIAEMLIQGISMGSLDMEKKLSTYEKDVDKDQLKFAKEFLKFQEYAINELKRFL